MPILDKGSYKLYNKIKKQNGESFAKAIRNYDNGIFDVTDLDKVVKYAGCDAEVIMDYLISLKNIQIEEHGVYEDPIDLLKKAGYNAFYVDTLEKQNSIEKYYSDSEKLCTFRDFERYKKYHIIHCVKENAEEIKRSDNPEREDDYGTSVISIQILKTGGFISIKNRYNHGVTNCDNTFSSNPDNIIGGLSQSIKHKYNADFSSKKVYLPEKYIDINGQIIKFNTEVDNIYYGDSFYFQDGKVFEIDKNKEIMFENYILNLQTKEIKTYSKGFHGFKHALDEEIKNKKLQIIKNEKGNKCLVADNTPILELSESRIISINFPNIVSLTGFLSNPEFLVSVNMPNLRRMGNYCLSRANSLKAINMPLVETIGSDCFMYVNSIEYINMPKLKSMEYFCFYEIGKSMSYANIDDKFMSSYMKACIRKNKTAKPEDILGYAIKSKLITHTR